MYRPPGVQMREIRDPDEEEEERKERLQEAEGEPDDGDESEDEDFKLDENDVDEEDGDEGEYEEGMECEIAGKGKAAPSGKRKRAAVAPKKAVSKKPKKAKGARGGGIALSDDEDDGATSAPAGSAQALAAPPVDPKKAEEDAKQAAADAKKAAADALWAELNGSSAPKKPAPKPVAAGGLDIKSLLAQAGAGSSSESGKMVTITETMSFAGKDVSVTKKVMAGSKEELAHREQAKDAKKAAAAASGGGLCAALAAAMSTGNELQRQMTGAKAAPGVGTSNALAPGLAFTGKLAASMRAPVQAPVATSLSGLLASIDGKKKMTAMEKSRHDWAGFKEKQDEQTRDEMSKFAKDGYLEKQAFLARTDQVQAQVARSNRRKGMGLKD